MGSRIPLLVIQGPTASGKTAWALRLAQLYPLEILSADSRQVYRRMDIGTAKATAAERAAVAHHMLDLVEPDQPFSVADFVAAARPIALDIHRRGKLPCVVGGTGLYIRGLVGGLAEVPKGVEGLRQELRQREAQEGPGTLYHELEKLDPASAATIHPNNLIRIIRALEVCRLSGQKMSDLQQQHSFSDEFFRPLYLAPFWPKEALHRRIAERTSSMLTDGLLEETAALVRDYGADLKNLQTLGYREVLAGQRNNASLATICAEIELQTRRYAKRQMTWFRKQSGTIWVDSCQESGRVTQFIDDLIQQQGADDA